MSLFVILGYHAALIALAYYIGRNHAAPGIAVFFAGMIGFQMFVNGPSSFIDGGCREYGHAARDC